MGYFTDPPNVKCISDNVDDTVVDENENKDAMMMMMMLLMITMMTMRISAAQMMRSLADPHPMLAPPLSLLYHLSLLIISTFHDHDDHQVDNHDDHDDHDNVEDDDDCHTVVSCLT